jgi:urea transport system substrate-binding protein
LLFYPVQYEGEELSKNVFYTGAAPNQQAIPAVEYQMSKDGRSAKRRVLLGTDYEYPRTDCHSDWPRCMGPCLLPL